MFTKSQIEALRVAELIARGFAARMMAGVQ